MKKKGYALVECMIAMAILVILITFSARAYVLNIKMEEEKESVQIINNIIDFIDKEIKYNMTLDEVKEFLKNDVVSIENSADILEEIKKKDLVSLKEGTGIKIRKRSEGDNYIDYNIEVDSVGVDSVGVSLRKSRWMDETR